MALLGSTPHHPCSERPLDRPKPPAGSARLPADGHLSGLQRHPGPAGRPPRLWPLIPFVSAVDQKRLIASGTGAVRAMAACATTCCAATCFGASDMRFSLTGCCSRPTAGPSALCSHAERRTCAVGSPTYEARLRARARLCMRANAAVRALGGALPQALGWTAGDCSVWAVRYAAQVVQFNRRQRTATLARAAVALWRSTNIRRSARCWADSTRLVYPPPSTPARPCHARYHA